MQMRTSGPALALAGKTEKNIAAAFREARDGEAFPVFDEADSLLADRRHAVRNREVGETNQMPVWMESHPLPFACNTKFADRPRRTGGAQGLTRRSTGRSASTPGRRRTRPPTRSTRDRI